MGLTWQPERALVAIKYSKSAWQEWMEDLVGWKAIAIFCLFVFLLFVIICASICVYRMTMWKFKQRINIEVATRVAKETNDRNMLVQAQSTFNVLRADSKDLPYMNGDPEKDTHQIEMIRRNCERGLKSKYIRRNAPPDVAFEDEEVKIKEPDIINIEMKREQVEEIFKKQKEEAKRKYLKAGMFNPDTYQEELHNMKQAKFKREKKNDSIGLGDEFKSKFKTFYQ